MLRFSLVVAILLFFVADLFAGYAEIFDIPKLNCARDAIKLVDKRRLAKAVAKAKNCNDKELLKLIYWRVILNEADYKAEDIFNFAQSIDHFPRIKNVYGEFEERIDNNTPYDIILKTYQDEDPVMVRAYEYYAKASRAVAEDEVEGQRFFKRIINKAFISGKFKTIKVSKFHKKYQDIIELDSIHKKISNLIWDNDIRTANYLLKYADPEYITLFNVRKKLKKKKRPTSQDLKSLSATTKVRDDGFLYDVAMWLDKKGKDEKIDKYILSVSDDGPYYKKWYKLRMRVARELLKKQEYEKSYKMVNRHNITKGSVEYADIEWYAGWVALRYLGSPLEAIGHFRNTFDNVSYPVSIARASYWLGRAYAEAGQRSVAEEWYRISASYSTTYYGQMAILEMQDSLMINLPQALEVDIVRQQEKLQNDELVKIAMFLEYSGKTRLAYEFLKKAIQDVEVKKDIEEILAITKHSKNYYLINRVGKFAQKYNVISLANFPVINNINLGELKEKSLVMSIIKQESGFNKKALSRVGATGFMQLMPKTAKDVSRRLKIPYSKYKLRRDAKYNIKLGSYYMNYLLKNFDGSYVLAIASYNAGMTNTRRWIRLNGDPRETKDIYEVIDWVELITFNETRNYVQRVIENSVIYMHLLDERQKLKLNNKSSL
jgi:soluble lytic murein transglycosylase